MAAGQLAIERGIWNSPPSACHWEGTRVGIGRGPAIRSVVSATSPSVEGAAGRRGACLALARHAQVGLIDAWDGHIHLAVIASRPRRGVPNTSRHMRALEIGQVVLSRNAGACRLACRAAVHGQLACWAEPGRYRTGRVRELYLLLMTNSLMQCKRPPFEIGPASRHRPTTLRPPIHRRRSREQVVNAEMYPSLTSVPSRPPWPNMVVAARLPSSIARVGIGAHLDGSSASR